jgi:hypothetical protein
VHADNYGGNDIAIYFYTLDDNRGPVHARIHNRGEHLDGAEYNAAIDQLLDHIDFARIARAVNRRGYAVDVTESDPDIVDDALNRYRTAFVDALALRWAGHDAEPVVPAQFVAAVIDPGGAPRDRIEPAHP